MMSPERMRRLRRLSSVPRWTGVPMIRTQMVDNHSFHVAPIALWLAESHIRAATGKRTEDILMHCLIHDEGEAVYGDPPSPSKKITGAVLKDFDTRRGYGGAPTEDVRVICKVADCLEAMIWCKEEEALGNQSLGYVYEDILQKMTIAWQKFDWDTARGDKPLPVILVERLWAILHISKHPVMEELI